MGTPSGPPPSPPMASRPAAALDLGVDVIALTTAVCDIPSVSGDEQQLADAVQEALTGLGHLEITRVGNSIVARTNLGRDQRVILAGHLDTVPLTDPPNLPVTRQMIDGVDTLVGRGTVDMLGGVAVQLRLAARLTAPSRDVTFIFYDCEEIEAARNGLGRISRERPDLLIGDFAVLLEPTAGLVEGGCKGTLRVEVTTTGVAAHSGRPWMGDNAVHKAGEILTRLANYTAAEVAVDGLTYHEGMSAVGIRGGGIGNVVPDRCVVTVNYRFAPDKTAEQAVLHVKHLFEGFDVTVTDLASGARPGLNSPAARDFVDALGVAVTAKEGWTDVARFADLGIPAVNFGPGDPLLAHKDDERCPVHQLREAESALLRWLS